MRKIEYDKRSMKCRLEFPDATAELEASPSVVDTLIISIKENIKHVTYSLNRTEEMALYELLRRRNE